jgi:hypothetical protein
MCWRFGIRLHLNLFLIEYYTEATERCPMDGGVTALEVFSILATFLFTSSRLGPVSCCPKRLSLMNIITRLIKISVNWMVGRLEGEYRVGYPRGRETWIGLIHGTILCVLIIAIYIRI